MTFTACSPRWPAGRGRAGWSIPRLPLQRDDFYGLFTEMAGRPVTIRLFDPPLHEFLPNAADLAVEVDRARVQRPDDVPALQRTLHRVFELEETNPMLGTRGARLGI